jgi:hypothetical protein
MPIPLLLALLQAPAAPDQGKVTIEVTPQSAAVRAGDTLRLRARGLATAGGPSTAPVTWRATGEGTVDESGLVRAGYAGYVHVTAAAANGATARATIVVHPRPTSSVEIRPVVRRIVAGTRVTLHGWAFSPDGDRTYEPVEFHSANPRIARITPEGRLEAVASGSTTISATAGPVTERMTVTVLSNTVTRVTITPGTATARTGDVVRFTAAAVNRAGHPIPDVFAEWSVAALTYKAVAQIDQRGAFVAAWPGKYTVTADIGGRRADAVIEVRRRTEGSAVEVLGRLPLPIRAEALSLAPGGLCVYIGTDGGPVYVVDVSRPDGAHVVDSMSAGGARVASIHLAPDRPVGVFTREHAPRGSAGLVVFDAADPCHPRPVAEHAATDSTGTRAAWVDGDYAYVADAASGSLGVLDLSNPARPREVARWQTNTGPGRRLDDVSVHEGVAYLAYWNDGLVILDVGRGIRAGLPESPVLVAQYRYDLNDMYARVDRTRGLGPRGTHTARRVGNFVLIADEVRPADDVGGDAVFGRLNAIDVADLTRPNGVAWYEPTDAGVHDLWVDGDTAYIGASQGGFRVLDLTGELKGDLLGQGREIAWLPTADSLGVRPFRPMTRGVTARNGLLYALDANSGLWILRLVPPVAAPPVPQDAPRAPGPRRRIGARSRGKLRRE